MKFLKTVVDNINKLNLDPNKTLILTTNAQSIRYLQTSIKSKISTLDSLVLANCNQATNLELLIKLFHSYQKFNDSATFNSFVKIGGALLHDFDVIDRCLVNVDDIFSSVLNQKQLSSTFTDLPIKQQSMILKFWNTFKEGKLSKHQDSFLAFWSSLGEIYKYFSQGLIEDNVLYNGLAYKIYCNDIDKNIEILKQKYENIVMVGFFPIYQSDIHILNFIKSNFCTYVFSQEENKNDHPAVELTFHPSSTSSKQIFIAIQQIQKYYNTEQSLAIILPYNKQLLIQLISSLPNDIIVSSSLNFPIELSYTYDFIEKLIFVYQDEISPENLLNNTFIRKNDINLEDLYPQNRTLVDYILSILKKISKFSNNKDVLIVNIMLQQLEKLCNYDVDSLFIKPLLQNIQIPINTEVKSNIYILPLQDTSNLDFDHVVIIGANDSCLPSKIGDSSLIPYNLRRGYGLPTTDTTQYRLEKFYFYKLINNSKSAYIMYNTSLGDKSRFLYQLEYESNIVINYKNFATDSHICDKELFLETSNLDIDAEQIKKIKVFSPSMINMYLDCPYKFFLSLLIKEKKSEYNLGLLVHKSLQNIYKKETLVTYEFLESINVEFIVNEAFDEHKVTSGEQLIEKDVAILMVKKALELDREYVPFTVIETEYIAKDIDLYIDGETYKVNGIIDRIDKKGTTIRIIDYKTGLTKNIVKNIQELFDTNINNRAKGVLQVLLYALMLQQEPKYEGYQFLPQIYNLRSSLNDCDIYINKNKVVNVDYALHNDVLQNLEIFIKRLISTTSVSIKYCPICKFCNYINVCQK